MKRIVHLSAAAALALLPSVVARATITHARNDVRLLVAHPRGAQFQLVADTVTPKPETRIEHKLRRLDKPPMESVTFLGIETAPVTPTLVAQLALPQNAGLVVVHIVPDSAAAGVLQEHDILLKLDDQILIDQHQLSVLVRGHKEGDQVMLTYMRAGKQATATVKLTKHEVPKVSEIVRPMIPGFRERKSSGQAFRFEFDDDRKNVDKVLSLIDDEPSTIMRHERIDAKNPTELNTVLAAPDHSTIGYVDEKGSLDLTIKDGRKTLVAKDAAGAQLFSGPIDSPEQRAAMPADVRERLEKLESTRNMTFRTDDDFEGGRTIIYEPAGKAI